MREIMTHEEVIEVLKAKVDKLKKDNIKLIKYQDDLENKITRLYRELNGARSEAQLLNDALTKQNAENDKLVVELHETEKDLEEALEKLKDTKSVDDLYRTIEQRDAYIEMLEESIINQFIRENRNE